MSLLETTDSVQKQVLDTIKSTEDAVVSVVKQVVSSVEPVTSRIPEITLPGQVADQLPEPGKVVDQWFGFAEKLLASQKAFAKELVAIFNPPAPKPVKAAAKTAKAVA